MKIHKKALIGKIITLNDIIRNTTNLRFSKAANKNICSKNFNKSLTYYLRNIGYQSISWETYK